MSKWFFWSLPGRTQSAVCAVPAVFTCHGVFTLIRFYSFRKLLCVFKWVVLVGDARLGFGKQQQRIQQIRISAEVSYHRLQSRGAFDLSSRHSCWVVRITGITFRGGSRDYSTFSTGEDRLHQKTSTKKAAFVFRNPDPFGGTR
ncbi:hypothetical protein CEXT_254961 [Caerostris extrusa]|uniref:Secreted protein n=1 Tax=Caerostris extrusa TaxID=172846 RepID=A0AAV4RYC3_CAEEX|nr:hypothetical protein CEXT_254961 [Caerostris extrusa]